MAHNERIEEIARLIQSVRKVTVAELSERFGASQVTIRKDLEALERAGVLLRTHGGAVLAEDRSLTVPFSQKLALTPELKDRVAERAAGLIGDANTVILDAGTTTQAIARRLAQTSVSIITNSLAVANELAARPSGTLVLLGGDWRAESAAFIGPHTLKILNEINADVAFVGATGFSGAQGFTCQNTIESQVKECIISRARHAYIVADSTKWNRVAFSTFARSDDIEAVVTDDGLSPEAREELEGAGVYVLAPSDDPIMRPKSKAKDKRHHGKKHS